MSSATTAATRPRRRLPRRWRWIIGTVISVVLIGVATAGVVIWNRALLNTAGSVTFDRELAVPALAESGVEDGVRVFRLDLRKGETDFGQEKPTPTIGINGSYLGPTLRAERGERVRVEITNSLGEISTIHWHGMHVPPAMDGGPHQLIDPDETWKPAWTIDQPAATVWYHPHVHGNTADQVYRGLAGFFLLDDPATAEVAKELPHDYGVDDFPVVVQDKRFHADGTLDMSDRAFTSTGVLGPTVLVNGTPGPYLNVTTEKVRLRLLNGSNARFYNFGFADGRDFEVIASDSGLLNAPVSRERLQLSPGDRAEIIVSMSPGERTVLRSYPQSLGTNMVSNRFSGGDDTLDIMELRAAKMLAPSHAIPAKLSMADDQPTADESPAVRTRRFELSGTTINNKPMSMSRVDEVVTEGTTEIWEVTAVDDTPHNFHIHDVRFTVLDVGAKTPPMELQGPQDTVYIRPGRITRLLVTFQPAIGGTDPTMPYMFHCHLLRHEDQGMMGQFVVVAPGEKAPDKIDVATGHDSHDGAHGGDGTGPRSLAPHGG